MTEKIVLDRYRYRVKTVAYYLDSSTDFVYDLIRSGRLEAASSAVGSKGLFVTRESFAKYLEETVIPFDYWKK